MTPRSCGTVLLAVALLGIMAPAAVAQTGKVTGVVTDRSTGQPISGAQVQIEELGLVQITDGNGRYFFLAVPPGVHSVTARFLGYSAVRRENVQVVIDATTNVDIQLPTQAIAVEPLLIEAERVPLVTLDRTGSGETLTANYMLGLPVSGLTDVLGLQAGFLQVPPNTEVIAYAEERRGVTPLRIRGGRGAETLTLIDGIPVNNFVLGGPAVDLTVEAVAQVDFKRGGWEPQYGNALSGIIDVATKEGGPQLAGALDFRTSAVGDFLGNGQDKVRDWNSFEGFISGPVPGTDRRLRFMAAGRQTYGPARVLEFDDDVFNPSSPVAEGQLTIPFELDLIPGWRAFGYDVSRDAFSKATYYFRPTAKLSASWLTYDRQTQGFDYTWMFAGIDPLDYARTPEDSAQWGGPSNRFRQFSDLVQGSIRQQRDLYVLRWDHTMDRSAYQVVVGRFDQKRVSCNWAQGVCLEDQFEDPNFIDNFVAPGGLFTTTPTVGTDYFYGGETIETWVVRADVQNQITDSHNIRAGVFFQRHDVLYDEWECSCFNAPDKVQNRWSAKPWDAAFYLQDKIEYDFVTIDLGFRFDYGQARASFFADPLDPTNGTTALAVCADPGAFRIPSEAQQRLAELGQTAEWLRNNCGDQDARAVAALIAAQDDFAEAPARRQFSPRIGVSFPVTENSNVFLNFGRYSQNPILKNLYWFTGAGSPNEGTPAAVDLNIFEFARPFLGNPRLGIETTNAYEIGYLAQLGDDYAFTAVAYAKDQTGLTGVRLVGEEPFPVFDPGVTYGSPSPQYLILVNSDHASARGFEFGFRRRVSNHWGFDLNYAWSRTRVNASEPERERERMDIEAIPSVMHEYRSEVDQPHVVRAVLRLEGGETGPDVVSARLANMLADARLAITLVGHSGLPYTPMRGFGASGASTRDERNSGTGPFNWQVDMRVQKLFRVGTLRYEVFADVINLFDRKNCVQVFVTTGDCDAGTIDQRNRRQGNVLSGPQARSTFFDRPDFQAERRRIDAGIRVSF